MKERRSRMDFVFTNIRLIDEKTGLFEFSMVPDPDRYEQRTMHGEEGYYDKYDRVFISTKVLADGVRNSKGLPIYGPGRAVRDFDDYFAKARTRISTSLASEVDWKAFADRGEAYLKLNLGREPLFVVLYIDIVGSTNLSRALSNVAQRTLLSTFLTEMTLLIDGHEGYVHKYTGDGLIAFFPAEYNFTGTTDKAVDCGIAMRLLVRYVLNPLLKAKGYPTLECRIGIDSGETQIVGFGAEDVKSSLDLLSYTMNIAAKICAVTSGSDIMIGGAVYKSLHVSRKIFFEHRDLPKEVWDYLDADANTVYPLYGLAPNTPASK